MGTLAEDDKIIVSKLIKLWVAEGFVKPSKTESLEEVAEGYLKDLVDRNLINGWNYLNGEIDCCSIHDLLRDLCLKKPRKENFLCVMRVDDIRQGIDMESCFVFNQGRVSKPVNSYIVESAFLCSFKMLRVLNAPCSDYGEDYILKQVNLRYISINNGWKNSVCLHPSISLLWNLQTLTIDGAEIVAPREIWEMPQLRHVNVTDIIWLPDPPLSNRQDHEFVMRNLQTLGTVLNPTEEVIPNVKILAVSYDEDNVKREASYDFGRLHKLEHLACEFDEKQSLPRVDLLQNLTFPSSLQDLYLQYCYLHWEDLTMIGSLPHLRALNANSVIGSEWNPVEGEFLRLRFLQLDYCNDLINWNADDSHFPVLEKLVLHCLPNLNEIPSGLGEIPTLAEIKLYDCSESSTISAIKILDEQEIFGNQGLRVRIGFWNPDKLERFKEKIEQFESSTRNNLQLWSTT